MITTEIFVFITAVLFGIIWYWRESKNNNVYRFFNKLLHSKNLQMKPSNNKAFVYKQSFLIRLVWISVLYITGACLITFVFPINVLFIQYFISAIAGTLIGSYIASFAFSTSKKLNKDTLEKHIEEAYNKGKDFIEDVSNTTNKEHESNIKIKKTNLKKDIKESARERLKNKGMIR